MSRKAKHWFIASTLIFALILIGLTIYLPSLDTELNTCDKISFSGFILNIDTWVYLRAGCAIKEGLSPYLKGEWSASNPDEPNTNFRFFPWWGLPSSLIDPERGWPIAKSIVTDINGILGWSSILLSVVVVLIILPNINWWDFFCFAGFASILWIQTGFGHLDPTMLFLSLLLLLTVWRGHIKLSGLLAAIIFSLKLYIWLWPLAILPVRGEWRKFFLVLGWFVFFLLVMVAAFLIVVGPAYGGDLLGDFVVFILSAAQNMHINGPEEMLSTFNNSIYQTLVRYFGFQEWTKGMATAISVSLIAYLIGLGIYVSRTFKKGHSNQDVAALLFALQAHVVFMLTSPQLETMMIIMFAFPLLLGLRSVMKVEGVWLLIPYFVMVIPTQIYALTKIPIFNLPFSLPLVLFSFCVLGVIIHRTIPRLRCAQL